MDTPLLKLDPCVKNYLSNEKSNWKGLSLANTGLIGEGLLKKTTSFQNSKLIEKLKKIANIDESLLKFHPVTESQLVKSSIQSNMFSKGNFFSKKYFKYKIFKADARLVRSILETTGFSYTDSHDWTVMWLGCNAKLYLYEGLSSNQRINHFPNSYEITRKDRMCVNLMRMQHKHGQNEYGFFPETYLIPNDFSEFSARFRNDRENKWIVKPANSSQGRGIFLLENIYSLRTSDSCVVSRFIDNPLLINDLKFDLRIYVLVTSFAPLKIYVYDEGLARFASEKYSNFAKNNKFSFLTNYSINKLNQNYIQNEDPDIDNQGHKWSLSALLKYLRSSGVDTDIILLKVYDLIIKTIITAESTVVGLVNKYNLSRNNCFDLFGFDVLLDEKMNPWLLEVNLSPSLATESPLDLSIKSNLVAELFNIIGIKGVDQRPASHLSNRASSRPTRPQTAKPSEKSQSVNDLISESFAEFLRATHFVRVYPVEGCFIYDKFFNVVRKVNKTLYDAMFCQEDIRQISQTVITGEDLLIEFLVRLLASSEKIVYNKSWENAAKDFVNNEIWKKISLKTGEGTWFDQLSRITAEIKRRNFLVKDPDSGQKMKILGNMRNEELEKSLMNTQKEISFLISCFFRDGIGILTQMQKFESLTPKRINFKNVTVHRNTSQEGIFKGKSLRSTSQTFHISRQKKKPDSSQTFKVQFTPFY